MANAERLIAFARGQDVEIRARLAIGGVQQRGCLAYRSGALFWEGVPEANRAGVTEQFIDAMNDLVELGEDADGTEFHVTLDVGSMSVV